MPDPIYEIHQGVRTASQAPFWVVLRRGDGRWQRRTVSAYFTSRAKAERCIEVLMADDAQHPMEGDVPELDYRARP